MPLAVEQFDLSGFDLVLSSSHAVAKGAITGPGQLHIGYIHSPIRYAWDFQTRYLEAAGLRGLPGAAVRLVLHYIRLWDLGATARVDHLVANSLFIARRIEKLYRREAQVIHPPVDTDFFTPGGEKGDAYVTAARLVPYKRIDLIVEAFAALPDRNLVVIGDGPGRAALQAKAGANVEFTGFLPREGVRDRLRSAAAFVFAAEEDFGIAPLEAQACGTPVIAYGKGGALETVIDGETGLFFGAQTAPAIAEAVREFERRKGSFQAGPLRQNALRFSKEKFKASLRGFVEEKLKDFESKRTY
jgi:glycosyltransferase involved in cell wall biosynthesis